jgi:hypothetical protein
MIKFVEGKGWGLFADQDIPEDTKLIGKDEWKKTFQKDDDVSNIPCEFGTVVAKIKTKNGERARARHDVKVDKKIAKSDNEDYLLSTGTVQIDGYHVTYVIDPYYNIFGLTNEPKKRSEQNVFLNERVTDNCLKIFITTLKDIKKGEEIQWYYGDEYPRDKKYKIEDDRIKISFKNTDRNKEKLAQIPIFTRVKQISKKGEWKGYISEIKGNAILVNSEPFTTKKKISFVNEKKLRLKIEKITKVSRKKQSAQPTMI